MELIPVDYTKNYQAYKAELDTELNKAAEGFVKIGYLLKVARDTNVLEESGYSTVAEFAASEYGLTKDVVSRYIAINDRFSENGYSPCLAERYSIFGYAKLQEMLTLPDSILEHISADTTKSEIVQIKKEYADEQSISNIEVAIEAEERRAQSEGMQPSDITPSNNMEQLIYDYLHGESEEYARLFNIPNEDVYGLLVPTGSKTIIGRVPGVGKLIMSIKDIGAEIVISNMRDTTFRETYTWIQLVTYLQMLCSGTEMKDRWKEIYREDYPVTEPEKPQPAPASSTNKTSVDKSSAKPEEKKERKKNKVSVVKKPQKVSKPKETVIKEPETVIKELETDREPVVVSEEKIEVAPAQQDNTTISIYKNMPKDKLEEIFKEAYEDMDKQYHLMKKELRSYNAIAASECMQKCNDQFLKASLIVTELTSKEED